MVVGFDGTFWVGHGFDAVLDPMGNPMDALRRRPAGQ
jgi:hypothetical protein